MALWKVQGGKHGEHENKFIEENKIYLTWNRLNHDLSKLKERWQLRDLLKEVYPSFPRGHISNNTGQIWAFSHKMQTGDWVMMPRKGTSTVSIAEITGHYTFEKKAENPYFHSRPVKWIEHDIPRSSFDQDILYSLGAFMTVCEIKRNDAEKRIRHMAKRGWTSPLDIPDTNGDDTVEAIDSEEVNFEEVSRDRIAKYIIRKFKGHGLATLVNAILEAKGYTTYQSPEGPDQGIDILAGSGPLGFNEPKICVQVKSGSAPIDSPTLDQLIGTMQKVNAEYGLLVSWSGFKTTLKREIARQFFSVRVWDERDIIEELLETYERLDEELQAQIPLKRIWTIASWEEEQYED